MSELCKILIVDDEMLVRQGIRHHLNWEQYGFQIVGEAANGKEALDKIERLRPHIVITDIVMPVMDGEEFTRVLKAHYPHIEVIVLSSYGEFHYVRSTFQSGVADYILKPKLETDELLKVLIDTARKIPALDVRAMTVGAAIAAQEIETERVLERLLDRLLAGYNAEDDARWAEYFPYDGYVLFGADLNRVAGDPYSYMTALADYVKEHFRDWTCPTMLKELSGSADDKQLLMLVNIPRENYHAMVKELRKLADQKSDSMPEMVWIVSDVFTDIQRLPDIYREEWQKLVSYRFYFPGRTMMLAADLSPAASAQDFDMKQLMDDIRKKRTASAFTRIREYLDDAVSHYAMSPFEFKAQLGNMVFNVAIGAAELVGRNEQVKKLDEVKYAYFKAIDDAKDVTEAVASLEAFLSEVEELGVCSYPEDSNMRKLLDYIDEHYSEPLRLSSLSEHFHFNPSYLSGYFSAHNAEGFSEYLNKTRITKACELLREDELSISEISAKVGYSDHSYFTKVFKKHTGMSPSQYRRQLYGNYDKRE